MDLLHLEQQRLALEANLQRMRQTLKHWQTWEAEYEGLKEELDLVGSQPTADQLTSIAKLYDGELVNEKEIRNLSGLDRDSPRSAKQILGLIERRQEYVQKNIETVQRQFFDAEAKAEELAFATRSHSDDDLAGRLPLTEIHEELDDEGNVISSRLSQPEESTANIIASLRKSGLQDADLEAAPPTKTKPEDLKPAITNASPPATPGVSAHDKRSPADPPLSRTSSAGSDGLERPSLRKKSVSFTADTKPAEERPRQPSEDGRKSVSFSEKVAVMRAAPSPDTRSVSFSPNVEEIPPQPLGPASPEMQAQSTLEVPKTSEDVTEPAEMIDAGEEPEEIIVPEDESPEDARTRREMLEYHLNEVGNVVAQIDLDEQDMDLDDYDDGDDDNSSYFTSSEYLEDDDTPYTTGLSESEESEDEYGRTRRQGVSPGYRQQMEELERRLIGNLGPEPKDEDIADADAELDPKDVRRLVIRDKRNSSSSLSSENSGKGPGGKKRVSFAESLDVAEPEPPPPKAPKLQDDENAVPVAANASGPPGVIMATTLTERMPANTKAMAPSLDAADPALEQRELATEYYRRRNDIIKQQGGFKATPDEDHELGELMEERDGKLKKVSRFKAARIKPQ